ncbi:MAG: response regulator [Candidatus Marinimicrobia bacterium]|nr:response regulator [Candidatus Neomarinimicrobiota bacterium]
MKKKILVVDDDRQIVRLLSLRLKASNFDVVVAYDTYQCVQVAKDELPDLILLDIKMPFGGGIRAIEILKDMTATQNIPIIFITAFSNTKVKKLVMDLGAKDLMSKPFNSEVLIKKINAILNNGIDESDEKLLYDAEYSQNYLETNQTLKNRD